MHHISVNVSPEEFDKIIANKDGSTLPDFSLAGEDHLEFIVKPNGTHEGNPIVMITFPVVVQKYSKVDDEEHKEVRRAQTVTTFRLLKQSLQILGAIEARLLAEKAKQRGETAAQEAPQHGPEDVPK